MSHKKKRGNSPVPPGNRTKAGPKNSDQDTSIQAQGDAGGGASFQEQDPKRRLGNFSGAGEHPYQQPGGLNDANH